MQDPRHPTRRELFDAHYEKLLAAGRGKSKLIRLGRRSGVMSCPCGAEGKTLRITREGRWKSPFRAYCSACAFSVMEKST